jgi:hypothetical protein
MTTNASPDHELLSWLPVVSTLAGVIVGGLISFFINKWNFERDRDNKRRAAAMQIAAQLRSWLVDTMRKFRDHSVFEQPDPNEEQGSPYSYRFPVPSDIPEFPFADKLDQISLLESKYAEAVFLLVEKKSHAEHLAYITAEVDTYEEASGVFEQAIATVWLECLQVYKSMAKSVSWSKEVVTASELADMTESAAPKPREQNADIFEVIE